MSDWKTQLEPVDLAMRTMEESKSFRPMRRIVYPSILILDDGKMNEGEIVRIRKDTFSIGRNEGDLTFPIESLLSAKHCRFVLHQETDNQYHWTIDDLDSRHGTYLRCTEIKLCLGMEFLAGGSRFRFVGPQRRRPNKPVGDVSYYHGTVDSSSKVESLEICSYSINHAPQPIEISGRRMDVGSLSHPSLASDPFLEPTHFSVEKSASGTWAVTDKGSHNGIWVRIQSAKVASNTQIIAGEQRLIFHLPTIL